MNESQMLEAFSRAVEQAGGVRAFARKAGVSASYVSGALRGQVAIGDTLLRAAGIERVITYRKLVEAPNGTD